MLGNMYTENMQFGGMSTNVALQWGYDNNGNPVRFSANIGGTVDANGAVTYGTPDFLNQYVYDPLGRMTSITQTGQTGGNSVANKHAVPGYDSDSRLTGVALYASSGTSNRVASSSNTFDHASRLTDLTWSDASSNKLAAYHWNYDSASRVTDLYSRRDSSAGTPDASYNPGNSNWGHAAYGYDWTNQLTGTTYTNFTSAPTSNTSLSYDANGNRTSGSDVSSTNRLLFDGTYYYQYYKSGDLRAKYKSTTKGLDSTATDITTYEWDDRHELNVVNHFTTYANYTATPQPVSDWEVDYAYDAFGRMVSRSTGSSAQHYIYDGQNMALALSTNGTVIERELYGPAIDQVLASESGSTGTVNWLLADNQGTVRDVARYANGVTSVADHLVYDAFGRLTSQTNASNQPTFTYDGLWQDPATALDRTDTRWYDAVNGVFISQDPLGFGGGDTNLSRFCGNGPTNGTDPSGLAPMVPWAWNGDAFGAYNFQTGAPVYQTWAEMCSPYGTNQASFPSGLPGIEAWGEFQRLKSVADAWNKTSPGAKWFPWNSLSRFGYNLYRNMPVAPGVGLTSASGTSGGGTEEPEFSDDEYYMCYEQALELMKVLQAEHPQYWQFSIESRYSGSDWGGTLSSLWCSRANAVKLTPNVDNPWPPMILYPYKYLNGPAPVDWGTLQQFIQKYPNKL